MNPLLLEAAVLVLGLALLLFEMFFERVDRRVIGWAGIVGLSIVLALSFGASFPDHLAPGAVMPPYRAFYSADGLAMFFKRFALATTILVLVMSIDYLPVVRKFIPGKTRGGGLGEFLAIPILTCAGLMWMASAVDFVMIFVSLEAVTISFYVLVTYTRRNAASLEAGVKYLILGALSAGFFVYGITWVYGLTGETNLARVSAALAAYHGSAAPVLFAFVLITIALGFKIAAFPFQIWVPDVYQGAPTPVTAFLSVGSKAAGFAVFMRVLDAFFYAQAAVAQIGTVLLLMAIATLIYGNLAALPQNNLKRLLAYSSIAHAGYLLVAIASAARMTPGNPSGTLSASGAIIFYLGGYLLMTLLAFLVMIVVANHSAGDDVADFNGLARRSPFLAFAMLIAMVSLAGLPFTVGFFGKFFIFTVAIAQRQYLMAGVSVVTVACGFYYYLRVVRAMYFQSGSTGAEITGPIPVHLLTRAAIGVLIALILFLGVYPLPLLGITDASNLPGSISAAPAIPVTQLAWRR